MYIVLCILEGCADLTVCTTKAFIHEVYLCRSNIRACWAFRIRSLFYMDATKAPK